MKTLELKDICGYLPYGVKVYLDGKSYTVTKWQNGSNNNMLAQQDNGTSSLIFNSGRGDAKFILRPMSDLTEEITYRGEKFVPIDVFNDKGHFIEFDSAGLLYTTGGCMDSDWLMVLDKLNEWMFDYRGLISAGLAIDVNTLPENPYER
jgi:hypothetical protein